jgi:hypothetical protein
MVDVDDEEQRVDWHALPYADVCDSAVGAHFFAIVRQPAIDALQERTSSYWNFRFRFHDW